MSLLILLQLLSSLETKQYWAHLDLAQFHFVFYHDFRWLSCFQIHIIIVLDHRKDVGVNQHCFFERRSLISPSLSLSDQFCSIKLHFIQIGVLWCLEWAWAIHGLNAVALVAVVVLNAGIEERLLLLFWCARVLYWLLFFMNILAIDVLWPWWDILFSLLFLRCVDKWLEHFELEVVEEDALLPILSMVRRHRHSFIFMIWSTGCDVRLVW